jgi:glycosyltransferase involved in cell wall biosynthesis
MSKTRNILLLTPGFPKDENDYLCIPPLQDFLTELKKNYSSVNIIVASFQYPFIRSKNKWNDISVFSFGGNNSRLKKLFVWKNVLDLTENLKKNNQLDIVHSLWFGECALVGNIISSRFNIRHICTLMGQDVLAKNIYLKLINKNKLTIVSLSENQSELFTKNTSHKIDELIFWGIKNQHFDADSKREIDLLGVGSFIGLKNFSTFLNTVHKLKKEFPSVKAMLIGDGILREKLFRQLPEFIFPDTTAVMVYLRIVISK